MIRILLIILMLSLNASPCWAARQMKKAVKKGNLLYNKGEFSQALKNYGEALLDAPESDIVNFNLGAALYKTKDYQAAIEHFEKSLVSEDASLEQKGSYNVGNAKYKFGIGKEESDLPKAIDLLKEALRHYEHALELEPEDEDAKYNYDFVKKELERLQKKLEKQQQQQKEQKEQEKGEDKKEKEKQESQKEKEQKEKTEEKEKEEEKQVQEPEGGRQEQEQAESLRPEEQREQEQAPEQSAQPDEPEQMSEQEASMLLEGYAQEEEPKGLYKEKIPAFGLPDVVKDW